MSVVILSYSEAPTLAQIYSIEFYSDMVVQNLPKPARFNYYHPQAVKLYQPGAQ